jgi:hypothetical protein
MKNLSFISINETDLFQTEPQYHYLNTICIILILMFVFGIILNIGTISHTIIRHKKLEPKNILIINLAIADLVYIMGIPMFVS